MLFEKIQHFPVAFNLIFFLQELFLVLGKTALGLTAHLYHNNHTWEGSHEMASLMQGSGALAIAAIGCLCLLSLCLMRTKTGRGVWTLGLLWLAFHGLAQSLPQVTVASLDPGTDVGESLVGYMALPQAALVLLGILSVLLTVFISGLFCRLLLGFAPSDGGPRGNLRFVAYTAAAAGLAACFLIIPFRILPASQIVAPFLVFAFTVTWLWALAGRLEPLFEFPNQLNEKVYPSPIVALIALLLFFRLVLAPGITF